MQQRVDAQRVVEFARFLVVGSVGFAVDCSVTLFMLRQGNTAFASRLASFALAVTVTWALNRIWTFAASKRQDKRREYFSYVIVQAIGAAINLGVFFAFLAMFPSADTIMSSLRWSSARCRHWRSISRRRNSSCSGRTQPSSRTNRAARRGAFLGAHGRELRHGRRPAGLTPRFWCPGPDLNRQAVSGRGILSPLCIPVSPPGRGCGRAWPAASRRFDPLIDGGGEAAAQTGPARRSSAGETLARAIDGFTAPGRGQSEPTRMTVGDLVVALPLPRRVDKQNSRLHHVSETSPGRQPADAGVKISGSAVRRRLAELAAEFRIASSPVFRVRERRASSALVN